MVTSKVTTMVIELRDPDDNQIIAPKISNGSLVVNAHKAVPVKQMNRENQVYCFCREEENT